MGGRQCRPRAVTELEPGVTETADDARQDEDSGRRRLVRLARRFVPIVFYVLLAVFLGEYVLHVDWASLARLRVNWWWVAVATVTSLAFRYWGVGIWFFLLRRLGAQGLRENTVTLTYVYAKSWLGRYIPGAATWIVGKVYFASRHGVSRSRLGVSGLLEGALQITATLALALALLLVDPRTHGVDGWLIALMVTAFVGCVVCLVPRVFRALVGFALRLLRRPAPAADVFPDLRTVASAAGLYVVGAVISGSAYFFIAIAVYPSIRFSDAPFVVGAASMASAISMLAVFAPGGLGVREGIQALLLSIILPGPVALVIVVVTRVWSLAVDGLFFVTAGVPEWVRPSRPAAKAGATAP